MSAVEAEEAATTSFGPADEVARRINAELAVVGIRVAAVLALGAVAAFVFPLYVIPENSLPPATWPETPSEILALQRAAIGLWLAAGVLAAASVALSWTRWIRATAVALTSAAGVLAATVGVSIALTARWVSIEPSTPNFALAAPFAMACLGACVVAALWTRASNRRLLAAG
jgi:hypothetical protein